MKTNQPKAKQYEFTKTVIVLIFQLIILSVFFSQQSCINGNSESHQVSSSPFPRLSASGGGRVGDEISYWYKGKAEITSYKLEQARYGEMRKGEAVLIFVTEDFSINKQVKLDNPVLVKNDAVNVLKMNMTKNFTTGIYPYSMMLSVFTPFNAENISRSLKATASSQEWCGHTFTQLNLQNENYLAILHSYFENEGEQKITLPKVLLEDELWTLIRIAPEKIQTGEVKIIPSLLSQRLRHNKLEAEKAVVKINSPKADENAYDWLSKNDKLKMLSVNYPEQERTLTIYFTEKFPYQIVGWEETYRDGFGLNKKKLTTRAIKKKTLFIDYWNHNNNAGAVLRDSLELNKCP